MPQIFLVVVSIVGSERLGWRIAMAIPGIALFFMGFAYYFLTQDTPNGNFKELRERGELPAPKRTRGAFMEAAKDPRVWALFFIYAGCFGIELTINGTAALYFTDYFSLDLATAGLIASLFGLMNIFARSLGGIGSDYFAKSNGLRGRVIFMFATLLLEGVALIFFSRANTLVLAIPMLIVFSTFVQMSEGATFGVVPFINKRALGSVSGIVGAGGNFGAVTAGILFRQPDIAWNNAYLILGVLVIFCSFCAFAVRFSEADEVSLKVETQEPVTVPAA
jgi:NNP family nitrate/nitrite transporter-like MFS transporter